MVGKPGDLAIFDGIDRRPSVTPAVRLIPLLTQRLPLLSIGVNVGRRFTVYEPVAMRQAGFNYHAIGRQARA